MDCDACGYEWAAVHPVVAEYLECPGCHHMTPAPYIEEPKNITKTMTTKLESSFQIGERVKLTVIPTAPTFGYVRAIIFTSSKVRYSLWIKEAETTLHNIDSVYVEGLPESEREVIEMPEDNYS